MKFCPKCGAKDIKGTFCDKCAEKDEQVIFKDINILVCPECKRYRLKYKWLRYSELDNAIEKIAKSKIKTKVEKIIPIIKEHKANPGVNVDIELEINKKFVIPAKLSYTTCPKCSVKDTEYFEGILQLRNPNPKITNFIINSIEKQRDKGIFINNQENVKGGIDFYLTSKRYLITLGNLLNKKFKGELKRSQQLFSYDKTKSKNIYRVNVLFRVQD